jgi:hypothetical protein
MSGSFGISRHPPAINVSSAAIPSALERTARRWWNGSVPTNRHPNKSAPDHIELRVGAEEAGAGIVGESGGKIGVDTVACETRLGIGMIPDASRI